MRLSSQPSSSIDEKLSISGKARQSLAVRAALAASLGFGALSGCATTKTSSSEKPRIEQANKEEVSSKESSWKAPKRLKVAKVKEGDNLCETEKDTFELTKEELAEYQSKFSPEILQTLEKEIGKLANGEKVWNFLAKYNFTFENKEQIAGFVTLVDLSGDGISWTIDSLVKKYNVKLDTRGFSEITSLLNLDARIQQLKLMGAMLGLGGRGITEEQFKKFKEANLAYAKVKANLLCRKEVEEVIESFQVKTSTTVELSPYVLEHASNIVSSRYEPDWVEVVENDQELNEKGGSLYQHNSFVLATAFHQKDRKGTDNIKKNVIALSESGIPLVQPPHVNSGTIETLTREIEPTFWRFLEWQVNIEGEAFHIRSLGAYLSRFSSDLKGDTLVFDDELANKVTKEKNNFPKSDHLLVAKYLENKETIDSLGKRYGVLITDQTLESLVSLVIEMNKSEKTMPHLGKLDILDLKTSMLIKVFLGGDSESSFDSQINRIVKYLEKLSEELNEQQFGALRKMAEVGFRHEISRFRHQELIALVSNVARDPKFLTDCSDLRTSYNMTGNFGMHELRSCFNMTSKAREAYISWGPEISRIFKALDVKTDMESLNIFFNNYDASNIIISTFFEQETNALKQNEIEKIVRIKKAFGIGQIKCVELIKIIDVSRSLKTDRDIQRLAKLYNQFPHDFGRKSQQGPMEFIETLSIYLEPGKSEKNQALLRELMSRKLARKYARILKRFKVKGGVSRLLGPASGNITNGEEGENNLDELLNDRFYAWVQKVLENLNVDIEDYGDLRHLLYDYEKEEVRAFLVSKEAKELAKNKERVRIWELDDLLEEHQNRALLGYQKVLKDKFKVDIKEHGGAFGFGQDANPLEYLKALKKFGFIDQLNSDKTLEKLEKLEEALSVSFRSKGAFLYFLQINSNPDYYSKMLDEEFLAFVKKFKNKNWVFSMSAGDIDSILEAYESGRFFETLAQLKSLGDLNIEDRDDLETVSLIAKTPNLEARIKSEEFKAKWEKAKEQEASLGIKDLIRVDYLGQNGMNQDTLYEKGFEEFLHRVVQKGKLDLESRMELYPYYKDETTRKLLLSDQFKETARSLGTDQLLGVNVERVLFFMKNPNLIPAYKKKQSTGGFFFGSRESIEESNDVMLTSVLPSFALLETDETVQKYRKVLEKLIPHRQTPGDGFALKWLTETYPDIDQFRKKCQEIKAKLVESGHPKKPSYKEQMYLNDLLVLFRSADLNLDRSDLEAKIKRQYPHDVHRTDHNFFGYNSYNDLSQFNIPELNKINILQRELSSNAVLRAQIGQAIKMDVEQELTSEVGGLIQWTEEGSIRFQYIPAENNYNNGAYAGGQALRDQMMPAFSGMHQHALQYNNANYASPSGSLFRAGADVTVAAIFKVDGVVITSLERGKFAVHLNNERRDVSFVGVYDY